LIKIIVIGILLAFATNCVAQGPGPRSDKFKSPGVQSRHYIFKKENLATLPQDELSYYLDHAIKMRRTGTFMMIGGLAGFGSIFLMDSMDYGIPMFFVGSGTFVAGIPVLIINASRVNRVRKFMNSSDQAINIQLAPHLNYNQYSSSYQSGITLVISF